MKTTLLIPTLALLIIILAAPSLAYRVTKDCSTATGGWSSCCCQAPDGTLQSSACPTYPPYTGRCGFGNLGWTWNTPLQWQMVDPNAGFLYSGHSTIAACGNGLKGSSYQFYLTDLNDANPITLGSRSWSNNVATRTYSFWAPPAILATIPRGEYKAWSHGHHNHVQAGQTAINGAFDLYAYEYICLGTNDDCKTICLADGLDWYDVAPDGNHCRTECDDGMDNNGNGYVDFTPPAGIRAEPGCDSALDKDEICNASRGETFNGGPCPQCMDGMDNDGDGRADYPQDNGCASPLDTAESDLIIDAQVCEPDCTYTTDAICHAQCDGKNGCALQPACDNIVLGTAVGSGISMLQCCQGLPMPALKSDALTYTTDRDRIRSSRILKTASGESIVMQIVNYK